MKKKSYSAIHCAAYLFFIFAAVNAKASSFELNSSTLKDGQTMPLEQVYHSFGCTGKNISPDLEWKNAPEGTKSFAVTVYDPDAPTGSGWWHWLVFNLPATQNKLEKNFGSLKNSTKSKKNSIQSRTDFGTTGYGGPCPPVGDKPHRYIFKVFALKDQIALKSDAPAAMIGYYINSLKLAEASFTVFFGR